MEGLISSDRFQISKPLNKAIAKRLLDETRLKVIQIYGYRPDYETLENLNEILFKKRKDLTFRIYGYSDFWADVSFLNHLPEVERFDWDSDIFQSFEPLYNLKKLVHLSLGFHETKHKTDLSFLTDFSKTLESLSLHGDYKNLIKTIPNLSKLNTVCFFSIKLSDFRFLENLGIQSFGNYGSRAICFDDLKHLNSLKKLWIKANTTLESLNFIENLYNLEEIEIYYVSKIKETPNLENLKKLKKILFVECNRLENIEELKKLVDVSVYASGKMIGGRFYKNEI